MIVIFLILFTKVIADSDENKYIDLLPDAEKRQFIEKVARKIIKDVESKENGQKDSVELSDEQLNEHNDYVKELLRQETENIRRSKGEAEKKKDETAASEESLGVQPLDNNKKEVDNVDLTLRVGKERNSEETATDYIKVEIITDEVPIIKRSVQNNTDNEDSEELKSKTPEKEDIEEDESSTVSQHIPSEMERFELGLSSNVSSVEVNTTISTVDNDVIITTEANDASTQSGLNLLNKEADEKKGSEQVKINTRRLNEDTSNEDSNENQNTTFNETSTPTFEYFGLKSSENKSDDSNTTSVSEEFTTVSNLEKPTNNESTTENVDITTEPTITTTQDSWSESEESSESDSESIEITTSTMTSTMTDEGTTDLIIDTTSYKPPTSTYLTTRTTKTSANTKSTESSVETTLKPITRTPATKEEEKIIVEDFTSPPTEIITTIIDVATTESTTTESTTTESTTTESTTTPFSMNGGNDFNPRVWDSEEVTQKTELNDVKTTIKPKTTPEIVYKTTISPTTLPNVYTKTPSKIIVTEIEDKTTETVNKNFIELAKVYYNSTQNVKNYQVYEIPADVPPFIKNSKPIKPKPMTEQPYYVPIYNYSPNNAYYNPQNRLGPNANDNNREVLGLQVLSEESESNEEVNLDPQGYDMEYSEDTFDNIERKKFGNAPKLYGFQPSNKIPAQNHSTGKKRGNVYPEDYLESDYFFGRLRKDLERRLYSTGDDFIPNSNEIQHPVHSIQEMNLKDHVRAVRNLLFQRGNFGEIHENNYEIGDIQHKSKKPALRAKKAEYDYEKNYENDEDEVSMNSKKKRNPVKNDEIIKKIGNIGNSSKALFVMDEKFKEDVIKYIQSLRTKNNSFDSMNLEELLEPPQIKKSKEKPDVTEEEKTAESVKIDPERLEAIKKFIKYGEERLTLDRERMEQLNLKLQRRNDDVKIGVYLEVLKDMITSDNKALQQYDWLGTTVDIQASLQKLFELIALVTQDENVHPADMEILRYVVFLHKLATEIIEANEFGTKLRKKLALPRSRKKKLKQDFLLKEKGLINRVWLYLRKKVPSVNDDGALRNLNKFLMDVEDALYDLHDAIKNIAKVTKYKNQQWYQNLKDLYLNTDEKYLLELLLHMSVSRLWTLIEDSATHGLEDDYIRYMKKNKAVAKKTLEELLFIMLIIDEINKNVE